VALTQEILMPPSKLDLLQGTLDLMVLQTLATMGALHGYGIARRIEEKYYAITREGRKQWAKDTAYWNRLSTVMGRVLAMAAEGDL
jgi:PadR family transcriptional regulator PadR